MEDHEFFFFFQKENSELKKKYWFSELLKKVTIKGNRKGISINLLIVTLENCENPE